MIEGVQTQGVATNVHSLSDLTCYRSPPDFSQQLLEQSVPNNHKWNTVLAILQLIEITRILLIEARE